MKKLLNFVNNKAKSLNVFPSPVVLRHQLEPQYNTAAGGYFSIGLFIFLSALFYNVWVSLVNKDQVTTSTQTIRQFDPQSFTISNQQFMFAIGINGINMSDTVTPRYFDLKMKHYTYQNGVQTSSNVILQTCNEQHWVQLGQQFVDTYRRWDLSKFLCPKKTESMTVTGKYTSSIFSFYKISIGPCTGANCKTVTQLNNYIASNTAFSFNFYYSNSLLNPDLTTPVSMFFQDKDYLMFSNVHASMMNLYISQYQMQTDQNLLPWTDYSERTGFILNRDQKQVFDYIPQSYDAYCKVYIRKSNIKYQISRSFLKIDTVLSYIGGLFGIIAVGLGVFMKYYGQCSFQLQMSEHIFQFNKTKKQQNENCEKSQLYMDRQFNQKDQNANQQPVVTPKQFGFLDFLVHLFYSTFKSICPSIHWKRMDLYEESLEQIRNKLQVSHLLEKLSFYDRAFNVLFDQTQLKLLYLQQKHDFQQVRDQRTMLNLKALLIANTFGIDQQIQDEDIKKRIDQKSRYKSTKRMKTFLGRSVQFIDDIIKTGQKDKKKLPIDIIIALQKLQRKIQQGDKVSVRIYNGLKYQFLQVYEKSKKQKQKNIPGKQRRIRIKQTPEESFKDLILQSSIRNFID